MSYYALKIKAEESKYGFISTALAHVATPISLAKATSSVIVQKLQIYLASLQNLKPEKVIKPKG